MTSLFSTAHAQIWMHVLNCLVCMLRFRSNRLNGTTRQLCLFWPVRNPENHNPTSSWKKARCLTTMYSSRQERKHLCDGRLKPWNHQTWHFQFLSKKVDLDGLQLDKTMVLSRTTLTLWLLTWWQLKRYKPLGRLWNIMLKRWLQLDLWPKVGCLYVHRLTAWLWLKSVITSTVKCRITILIFPRYQCVQRTADECRIDGAAQPPFTCWAKEQERCSEKWCDWPVVLSWSQVAWQRWFLCWWNTC